jgi:hypothetical protein
MYVCTCMVARINPSSEGVETLLPKKLPRYRCTILQFRSRKTRMYQTVSLLHEPSYGINCRDFCCDCAFALVSKNLEQPLQRGRHARHEIFSDQ